MHVNSSWKVDSSKSSVTINSLNEVKVYKDLINKLDRPTKKFGNLKKFYRSIIEENLDFSLSHLRSELAILEKLQTREDLPHIMAELTRRDYRSPIKVEFQDQSNDVPEITVTRGRCGFDRYYDLDNRYYDSLELIMNAVLPEVGLIWNEERINQVADLQRNLLGAYNHGPATNNESKIILDYLESLDINALHGVIYNFDVSHNILNLLSSNFVDLWKDYFTWVIVEENVHFLPSHIAMVYNDQVDKFTDMDLTHYNSRVRAFMLLVDYMPDELIRLYDFPPERKAVIDTMARHIQRTMVSHFKMRKDLPESYRQLIAERIESAEIKVAVPDSYLNYDSLTILPDDPLGNIRRAAAFNFRNKLSDIIQKGAISDDWYHTTLDGVIAYYSYYNRVVIPVTFTQRPLFSEKYDDAFNYGALGFYIGHEFAHSLDFNFGGDFLINSDSIRNRLIAQYGSYRSLEGFPLNGEFTAAENFADIVGLNAALTAYESYAAGGKPKYRQFFEAFANSQREYRSAENTWNYLQEDEHALSYLRVNGTLRNINKFYEVFDVGPEDSLYLPPEERIPIWSD
jgi:hypothetical protein